MTRRKRLDALEARQTARPARGHEDPARRALVAEGVALLEALPEAARADVLACGVARGVGQLLEGAWECGKPGEGEGLPAYARRAYALAFAGRGVQA